MRHIYKYASRVVVWLGISTPEIMSALNLLKSIKEMIQANGSADGIESRSQSDIAKVRNYLDTDMSAKEALSCLFCDLLTQAWWGRVWVIQEVAVSSRASVVIGDSELEWSSLCDAMEIISFTDVSPMLVSTDFSEYFRGMKSLLNIEALRLSVESGSPPSISTLFAGNWRQAAATDPRDLVYALLGLAKERDDPLLTPNYSDSNSALDVFTNLIEYSMQVENGLDIICLSQGRIRNGLPSWCPDWRNPPRLGWHIGSDFSGHAPVPLSPTHENFLVNNPWHACGNKSPVARIIRSPLTLACRGLLVDVVDVIGDPMVIRCPRNRLVINLHPWENIILNHFEGSKSKTAHPADGPSIFDVSDQYHRFMISISEIPNFGRVRRGLATLILGSFKAMSQLTYSSYRKLQKLRRKTRYLFQGFQSQYITGGPLAEAYVRTIITNRRLGSRNIMTDNDYGLFWSRVPKSLNDPAAPSPAPFHRSLILSMMQYTYARTLILTKKGYLGLGPTKARKGDFVCILYGCSVPVILRKEDQGHEFVGESYIHGLMDGAAVNQQSLRDTLEEREFILR